MDLTNTVYIDFLAQIARNCECEAEVRTNYSGRGMYGEQCHGIVGHDFVAIIEAAASQGITGAKYDSMGRDYIVYWPCPVFSDDALNFWGEDVDPN